MNTYKKNRNNNFTVKWENPDDGDKFWTLMGTHYPDSVTTLDFSVIIESICMGYNKISLYYENPVKLICRHVNAYVYMGTLPYEGRGREETAINKTKGNLKRVVPELGELWKNKWLPEIKDLLAWQDAFDFKGASSSDLAEGWTQTVANMKRAWEIHYLLIIPMRLSIHLFEEIYNELFPGEKEFGAYDLLGGRHKFIEAEEELWALSRKAISSDDVKKALLSSDSPERIFGNLKNSPEGMEFFGSFKRYLNEYRKKSYTSLLSKPFNFFVFKDAKSTKPDSIR